MSPIGELGSEKRTVVPFDAIPKMFVQAVVAAEDADYFKHGGVDYRGMARAFIDERAARAHGAGRIDDHAAGGEEPAAHARADDASARCRRSSSRAGCREKLTKEEILALYLNQIYYGHGRYGCEEAARYYFGKSVKRDRPGRGGAAGRPAAEPGAAVAAQASGRGQGAPALRARADGRARLHQSQDRERAGRRADSPGARDGGGARAGGARRSTSSGTSSPTSWERMRRSRRGPRSRPPWTRACRRSRARRWSAGWKSSTRARVTAGRRGTSPARRSTASAASWAERMPKFLEGSDIVEGIVLRFEKDATETRRSGKLFVDVGAGVPANARGAAAPEPSRQGKAGAEGEGGRRRTPLAARRRREGCRRLQPRAPLREGDEAARRPLQARRSGARAPAPTIAPTRRTGRCRWRSSWGRRRRWWCWIRRRARCWRWWAATTTTRAASTASQRAHRQPGSAFKPIIYGAAIEARRITRRHDAERRARGLRPVEAAELREGGVPRPGPGAHGARALDQHGRDQGAVGRRARSGARLRDARRDDVADRAGRRAVAGARVAGGDAARAGERLRHLRQRRHRRPAGLDPHARRRGAAAPPCWRRRSSPRSPTSWCR